MSYHSRQPSVASSIVSNPTAHPQFIGPWRLGKTLGRGATGRVLLATHRTNNQKAAVKVVSSVSSFAFVVYDKAGLQLQQSAPRSEIDANV